MINSMAKTSVLGSIPATIRKHPLVSLIVIAAILRLLAVIYAKGYMASDDHFVVIQVVSDWLNGIPVWFQNATPIVRGVVYQYSIYALMWLLKVFGITDPSAVMFVNRAVHAIWSLTIIPLVYYSLKYFTDERAAWYGGLLAGIYFLMPFFSVRNMIEVVCQPFLLAGIILIEVELKRQKKPHWMFLGGILLGAAFMIRIQTAVIPMAVFFVLLAMRKWKQLLWFSLGGFSMLMIEGLIDYISWGMFLSSVIHTLSFQSKMIHAYVTNAWYTHFLTILGILIPPFSLLVFPWIVATAKKLPISFWAVVAFLVIHSMIPQKQERYLLPILPMLIFLLTAGWSMVKWRDSRIVKGLWAWMWAVNLILLPIITLNYSQKARVEPLVVLSHMPNVRKVVVDATEKNVWLPTYYAQKPLSDFQYIFKAADYDTLAYKVKAEEPGQPPLYTHAIIFNSRDPEAQRKRLESIVGNLTLIRHFRPSLADWLLRKSNPNFNHSKESWLYSIG
jgi:4-amino-4-deoxy-L-arabinose transferase-like glycosyltransferase